MAVRPFFDPLSGASLPPENAPDEAETASPGADSLLHHAPADELAQGLEDGRGGDYWLDPNSRFAQFFDANYTHSAPIADKYAVDPTLILGVAALESGYGKNRDAAKANNPLGMRPDGHTPIEFPSGEAAWNEWGRQFGPRVLGIGSDADTFLDRLLEDHRSIYGPVRGGDYRGPLHRSEG
ncbi:MAG TPA: glucosaminidase domain-containing protein [Alphaproteobacteria bacterium]